jgi:hypothetical protein
VVPGNALVSPLPWMRMRDVPFLFAKATWDTWGLTLVGLAIGSTVALVGLAYCWLPDAQPRSITVWTHALFDAVVFSP